jgi:hypothetical protein
MSTFKLMEAGRSEEIILTSKGLERTSDIEERRFEIIIGEKVR